MILSVIIVVLSAGSMTAALEGVAMGDRESIMLFILAALSLVIGCMFFALS